ncbi:hybrid sensor histidine kinase/response regulator [Romeria aff. gracilis LEGE 07310]|uniref:histidine kinase n=1 Tax=Vasconcelosia minhoensis LEGE 07310 TaxID=915328 RepID=A0A8J7AI45_9CYAN|nr:hybrid sensor histidine kinase/response regulator [Romeria gracilis]MBE9079379.1 hybrid sensor histidine kinase/response regulator [Romeria aff. gracilis LEGE 07310]
MFIEDEELRDLYRDASQEHLDKLEAGILHLEKHPKDANQLKLLLREAHSLKGDSRMLGVEDAETLVHQIEELLIGIEQSQLAVTAELCDRIYKGLDAVRKIAHEAVTDEPSGVKLFRVLVQLTGCEESPDQLAEKHAKAKESNLELVDYDEDGAPALANFGALATDPPYVPAGLDLSKLDPELAAELSGKLNSAPATLTTNGQHPSPEPAAKGHQPATAPTELPPERLVETHQIDTIRVAAPKLDQLMTQAGELAVTKLRIARRMDDITQVLNLWETWSQENLKQHKVLDQLAQQIDPVLLAPLQVAQQGHDSRLDQFGELIQQLHSAAAADTARLETVSNELESGILKLRMLPLSSLFSLFPRLVRDLAKDQDKDIDFVIEGGETLADKRILEEMKAPLTHLIRNAIDHGIEPLAERLAANKPAQAALKLRGYQMGSSICIELIDDGRGLNLGKIKHTAIRRGLYSQAEIDRMTSGQIQALIFEPGFSTRTTVTELSGRGVGLDVVRTNVEQLKGSIQIDSTPGQGCTFRMTLGTSLNTTYALIVSVAQNRYAIPVEFVETMIRVRRPDIFAMDGKPTITFRGQPLSLVWLSDLLELSAQSDGDAIASLSCVVLKVGSDQIGLLVDALIEQQDIILKPQSKLLKRIRNITGATILSNGEICMVLNTQDLIRSAQGRQSLPAELMQTATTKPKVLLVEDSIPIRTQVKRILQGAGYEVTAAVDGLDGFEKLTLDAFHAVVSDIEMPNLTGLELTSRIRQQVEYAQLPVVLVSTLAKEEDRKRGADAGANAYLTKGDFNQTLLLDTLRRLI